MGSALRLSRAFSVFAALLLALTAVPFLAPDSANAATSLHYLYGSGSATGGRQITLRVQLTEPAPATGKRVAIMSSHASIPVPTSVKVPAGETELTFSVTTQPVAQDVGVTLTARVGTVTKSRVVVVKAPVLSSLSVQSRIRAGGVGKVTVLLSGRAPSQGMMIELESNRPSILDVPSTAIVTAGRSSISLTVAAEMVSSDVTVRVTARLDGDSRTRSTIVRNYGDPVDPTATPTATATASATGTATSSPTNTSTPETPTATSSSTPSHTATATRTFTATTSPEDLLSITLVSGSASVLKGSTVWFDVCLTYSPAVDELVSFSSNNPNVAFDDEITPTLWVFPTGSTGDDLCVSVSMTGRTDSPDPQGVGEVNLKANWDNADILSEPITFLAIPPTPTESATASATATHSATPVPTATATSTPLPTSTNVPTNTATEVATSTATLEPTATHTAVATDTNTPEPTATETATAVPTSTHTQTATATQTNSHTATATASPTTESTATAASTPSATATSTATHTATTVPGDPLTITLTSGETVVEHGGTVVFIVCLTSDADEQVFLSFAPTDLNVVQDTSVVPGFLLLGPGVVGPDLCGEVSMTGRTDGNNGTGTVQLRAFLGQDYYSEQISFLGPPPTATSTNTPLPTATETTSRTATSTKTAIPTATPTSTPTLTPTSTPTATATVEPTATPTYVTTSTPTQTPVSTGTSTPAPAPTATSTATHTATAVPSDPLTITLISGEGPVMRGSTVAFEACVLAAPAFVNFSSNNPSVALDEGIVIVGSSEPSGQWFVPAGTTGSELCAEVTMTGRTEGPGEAGIGEVQLRGNLNGTTYFSDVVTFVAEP